MEFSNLKWTTKDVDKLIEYLKSISDEKYLDFSKTITPTDMTMLGVNTPTLKKISKEIDNYEYFIKIDDKSIFELRMIKAFVISNIKDIDTYKQEFENFIPSIESWAVCDSFISASKIIKKDTPYFFDRALRLIKEKDEFLNRIGFIILLDYFVKDEYIDKIYKSINNYKTDKYYAMMGLAWLISVMYIKYPTKTLEFMTNTKLDKYIIKMSIRKIKDSYRVNFEDKEALKKLLIN